MSMDQIIEKGLKVAKMVVLKLPNNFDFEELVEKLDDSIMIIKHLIKEERAYDFKLLFVYKEVLKDLFYFFC